jgi:hypothetical protein
MLVRKKRENLLKKKARSEDSASEENLQSVRSWIRKIEQSTTSVSCRLSAVEKRLSTGMNETENNGLIAMNGRVETLMINIKKKSARAVARVLDGELTLLHNEVMKQEKEFDHLKEQLSAVEEMNTTTSAELKAMHTVISQINEKIGQRMQHKERPEPFVMHLGTIEIPVEFTGIIGGLLAFTIAILVVINQKEILLSPVFLCGVGVLLISVALLKMVRARSQSSLRPYFSMPLKTSSVQTESISYEKNEG